MNRLAILWCLATGCFGQLRVISPAQLKKVFEEGGSRASPDGIIPCSTATFGSPSYGESLVGRLIYIESDSCLRDYDEQLKEKYGIDPNDSSHASGSSVKDIFLIRRGGCTFVQKVLTAESAGADGVIIIDSAESSWTREQIPQVILSDDGNGQRVRIPSLLVNKEDGDVLAQSNQQPIISIEWNLPQKDLVRADLWISAGNLASLKLLGDLRPVISVLKGIVDFRVHYFILRVHPESATSDLCFENDPQLCIPPPDAQSRLTTQDVLAEDIRQLCISRLYQQPLPLPNVPVKQGLSKENDPMSDPLGDPLSGLSTIPYSKEWWDYVGMLPSECGFDKQFYYDLDCSKKIMKKIGIDYSKVEKCFSTNAKSILENEKNNNAWGIGAFRINGAKFSGHLQPLLITQALCSSFIHVPQQCQEAFKLFNGTAFLPQTYGEAHYSVRHIFLLLMLAGSCFAIGVYAYQRHTERGMRQTLRHEVMLEVKNQLQDYYRVDDPYVGPSKHFEAREMEFSNLKFRS